MTSKTPPRFDDVAILAAASLNIQRHTIRTDTGDIGMKIMLVATIIAAGLLATSASAAVKDPRSCTIKGTAGAPVYCASRAAEAAVKARMVARTHNPRWNLTVICNAEIVSQPLHQKCGWHSDRRRVSWGASVVFSRTAQGWVVRVTVRGPVPGI